MLVYGLRGGERSSSVTIPKHGEKWESGALQLSRLSLHFSYPSVLGYNGRQGLLVVDFSVQQSRLVVSQASWSRHYTWTSS